MALRCFILLLGLALAGMASAATHQPVPSLTLANPPGAPEADAARPRVPLVTGDPARDSTRLRPPETASSSRNTSPFVTENGVMWARGPGAGYLGGSARIRVTEGERMTVGAGAKLWLKQQSLPVTGNEISVILGARGAWMAVAALAQETNLQPAAVEALLKTNAPLVLAQLNDVLAARAPVGSQPPELAWQQPPQLDASGRFLRWCLEYRAGAQRHFLPAAAFFTAQGVITIHFRGPPRLNPELCFSVLDQVTITRPAQAPFAAPPAPEDWPRWFLDPRTLPAVRSNAPVVARAAAPPVATVSATPKSAALSAPANSAQASVEDTGELEAPKPFGQGQDDYLIVGLIILTVLIAAGLIVGTRARRPGGGKRRRAPAPAPFVPPVVPGHQAGVPRASLEPFTLPLAPPAAGEPWVETLPEPPERPLLPSPPQDANEIRAAIELLTQAGVLDLMVEERLKLRLSQLNPLPPAVLPPVPSRRERDGSEAAA